MGKQLWPIESRPFGGSIGHFFLNKAERPQNVLPLQRMGRVEKAAERLLERRLGSVVVHCVIPFGHRIVHYQTYGKTRRFIPWNRCAMMDKK